MPAPPLTPADVDARHPGWHAWLSDEGRCWATSTVSPYGGSGWTEDADTPEALDAKLPKAGDQR